MYVYTGSSVKESQKKYIYFKYSDTQQPTNNSVTINNSYTTTTGSQHSSRKIGIEINEVYG